MSLTNHGHTGKLVGKYQLIVQRRRLVNEWGNIIPYNFNNNMQFKKFTKQARGSANYFKTARILAVIQSYTIISMFE